MNKLPDFTKEGRRMFVASNRLGFTSDPYQALRISGALVVAPGVTRSIERQINKHRDLLWDRLLDAMEKCFTIEQESNEQADVAYAKGELEGLKVALCILVYGDESEDHLKSIDSVAAAKYDKEVGDV